MISASSEAVRFAYVPRGGATLFSPFFRSATSTTANEDLIFTDIHAISSDFIRNSFATSSKSIEGMNAPHPHPSSSSCDTISSSLTFSFPTTRKSQMKYFEKNVLRIKNAAPTMAPKRLLYLHKKPGIPRSDDLLISSPSSRHFFVNILPSLFFKVKRKFPFPSFSRYGHNSCFLKILTHEIY